MREFVGALDQGTTSTRFVVFDHAGVEVGRSQLEHRQFLTRPGWVEHDADEIWRRSTAVIADALDQANLVQADLVGIGIANQRETSIVWDRRSGKPLGPAIVWQDVRTEPTVTAWRLSGLADTLRFRTGLPLSTYSSAAKLIWLLDNVDGAREGAERGDVLLGTVDSWLIWKMSGEHITDVTNASRTMLMNLETLDWDDEILDLLGIPRAALPRIHASTFGRDELIATRLGDSTSRVAILGVLGDQQAALIGHRCFSPGDAKNTNGTGSFLLVNTGAEPLFSSRGLITTVAYQFRGERPVFALEGAVAVVGAAVQWLRDQLGIISSADEIENLANRVGDADGVYFVPAFAGLFAPYWRADARGAVFGLSRSHTSAHLARAVLEAIGFQTLDVVSAIDEDLSRRIEELHVDGGVTANSTCMQLQADILGIPVLREGVQEATALGAAYAAGLAAGYWASTGELPVPPSRFARRFEPSWSAEERAIRTSRWRRAIQLSLEWADELPSP